MSGPGRWSGRGGAGGHGGVALAGAVATAVLGQIPMWAVVADGRELVGQSGMVAVAVPVLTVLAAVGLVVGSGVAALVPPARRRAPLRPSVLLLAGGLAAAGCLAAGLWGTAAAVTGSYVLWGASWARQERALGPDGPETTAWRAALVRSGWLFGAVLGVAVGRAVVAANGNWRTVLLVSGVVSGVVAAVAADVTGAVGPDRAPEEDAAAHAPADRPAPRRVGEVLRTGLEEQRRRLAALSRVPLVASTSVAYVAGGACTLPMLRYLQSRLEQRWAVEPRIAVLVVVLVWLPALAAVPVLTRSRRRGRLAERGAGGLLGVAAAELAGAGGLVVLVAVLPWMPVVLIAWALLAGVLLVALVDVDTATSAVVPGELRGLVLAARTASFWVGGLLVGYSLLANLDRRFGVGGAMLALTILCLAGARALRQESGRVDDLVRHQAEERAAAREAAVLHSRGALPMLACQGIGFSYGQVQVLFDVDFSVAEGELVALLGTNGAGKSTLLRVISGLGSAQGGTVHFCGEDIGLLPVEQRVGLGITQIPGGKAVFGPLSVAENLRMFGFTLGRSRRTVEAALDTVFEIFPRLAERRDQQAQTLSGGEQHMLGVSRALLLQPKLLLIDELSLGLAPVIVGQLLELVREINRRGSAVVVVEQSVNVALSIARHAYFMEKGQIRFDGRASDLLDRPDLLRAVFLGGAAGHGQPADAGGPSAGNLASGAPATAAR